ncbi:TonB-dependent receptor domain-containing protein [Alteromonas sp. S015]|uniref:TonB-dependent receptor domain-containing protein n=1 Tax=Alteromonas sp. S015 TaxID=3117401 RepID=UPI002FE2CA2E
MHTKKRIYSAVRTALVFGTASALTPTVIHAQDLPSEENVEKISVTGSRIARSEFSSSSPISSFDSGDLMQAGVASIDEFLKDVPAFTGYQMGTSTNNGSDQGQKKIDLRGLGFNRTLVLINGRRMIGDASGDGAVDLNVVPQALIKRVDVLKDGASTIYGSDALSGVVNFVLDDTFEGVEFGANLGFGTEDRQARDDGMYVKAGVAGDKGNIVLSLAYMNQEEMKQEEKDFANQTLFPLLQSDGSFALEPSGSSNSRRIRTSAGNYIVDASSGQVRPFESGDIYDYSPVNALITPNERWQMAMLGKLELTSNVTGYFEGTYTRRTSQQRLAPDASFAVTPSIETPNNGVQWNDYVPANNPFNPFGVNGADNWSLIGVDGPTAVRINRRFVESGGRLFRQTTDTYRMVAGLNGSLLNDTLFWDASYSHSETETSDETLNYGRFDRWAIAVDPDACAADSACPGVLDPFSDYGNISQEQMDYLTTGSLKDIYRGQMELFTFNLSGEMFELPGGYTGWAVGYEHRNEEGSFSPDEFIANGLTTGGASDPLSGSFSVDEVYGELYLPVLENLTVNASARYSDYNTSAGDSTTYKIGADYAATEELRFRASYATGFRAPNIAELNQGDQTDFPIVLSVCEFGDRKLAAGDITQTMYDNCVQSGVDTTDAGEYGFAWQSTYTVAAPSEPLEPEESKSQNIGLVYQPQWLEGLAFNIDYWKIEIDKVIGSPDMNDLYRQCMNSVNFDSVACDPFDISGGPHNTAEFGIFPTDAKTTLANQGTLTTSGWDFDVAYDSPLELGAVQGISVSWSATYLDSYERDYPLTGTIELAGTANGFEVFPEWRWQSNIGIYGDGWTLDYKVRFIGEASDRLASASSAADVTAEQTIYHDIAATYQWENVTFSAGINNIADEAPPYFHSAFNANTEPGTYDVIGRRFFSSVSVSF